LLARTVAGSRIATHAQTCRPNSCIATHVVPNKHLSAVLTLIREQQLLETQEKLTAARTYRARRLIKDQLNRALSS